MIHNRYLSEGGISHLHDFSASSVKNPEKMFLYQSSKIFFYEVFFTIVGYRNRIILMAAYLKIAYESNGMWILKACLS
jgi:hypothetical protein